MQNQESIGIFRVRVPYLTKNVHILWAGNMLLLISNEFKTFPCVHITAYSLLFILPFSINLAPSCQTIILVNLASTWKILLLDLANIRPCKYIQDPLAPSCIWWVLQVLGRSCKVLLLDLAKTTVLQDLVSTCILLSLSKMSCKSWFLGTYGTWIKINSIFFVKLLKRDPTTDELCSTDELK